MVVPMKKYAFLVHHSDYENFLNGVREVGVLHVQPKKLEPTLEASRKKLMHKEVSDIIGQLKKRKVEAAVGQPSDGVVGAAIVRSVLDLNEELERTRRELAALNKEIEQMKPWGDFSPELVARLEKEGGIDIHFFVCPEKKFNPAWRERYVLEVIKTVPPDCYFVVFSQKGEMVEIAAETHLPDPEFSLPELEEKRAALEAAIEETNRQLDRHAVQHLPPLERTLLEIEEEQEMADVLVNTGLEADEKVMLLEGFVPETKVVALQDFCEKTATVYLAEKPSPKDNPPILLKNSRYARLFEPIGKLFALPSYAELDLTPFFAPFFMLFFGFCLGDAGYGIVLLVGASIYKLRAKPEVRPIVSLVQWLGLATIILGTLTGTFFGVNLLEDQFAWLGSVRNFMINSEQAFNFALMLGMIQILFGLGIQAANQAKQFGAKYALKPIGWIILLLSLVDIGVLKMASPVSIWTAWAGVAILMLFNDPDAGLFGRLGKGLWELYGITGFFGDLLSYIRLFALGISSAILGFVINDVSLRMLHGVPYAGPVLFVLLLVVGHSANLLIACLGSFVHPLRLTFVEFYKNAGFAGGGKAYKPFEKKVQTIK
ncbi:MAG: V-type ATP synthase subunit I [Saprospiraceae bacterium]|nr:V-type ATP synthase subunit I [Saprospiraceae bacterium]